MLQLHALSRRTPAAYNTAQRRRASAEGRARVGAGCGHDSRGRPGADSTAAPPPSR
jgi:hypothetical protein